jgi:hypothetical protein
MKRLRLVRHNRWETGNALRIEHPGGATRGRVADKRMGWMGEDDTWRRAAYVPRPHGVSRSVDGWAKQSTKKPRNPALQRCGSVGRSLLDLTPCERIPNCNSQTIPHSLMGVNPRRGFRVQGSGFSRSSEFGVPSSELFRTINPQPSTLPEPSNFNPQPWTLNPQP